MTPQEQKELEQHIRGIAKILYKDASGQSMESLGEIETVVRSQLQKHVSPQLGIFLSKKLQEQQKDMDEPSKAS